jgi:hypothetical protein
MQTEPETTHEPELHVAPAGHVPHEPLRLSGPHFLPAQDAPPPPLPPLLLVPMIDPTHFVPVASHC